MLTTVWIYQRQGSQIRKKSGVFALPNSPEVLCACNNAQDIKNTFFAKKRNTYIIGKDVFNNAQDI